MNPNPNLETIRKYYQGCSTGDVDLMKSTFTPDVTHYFTAHGPIRGAGSLANYWKGLNTEDRRSVWTVDHGIVSGDEAVIEWTMISTFRDGQPTLILRGAEWHRFYQGKIAEIRAYYLWTPELRESELIGFPYEERGYPTKDPQ